ncbi:hypothetical protein ACQVP2_27305 [Methylobacterium aquaticum]|uniref:hypothetical protein n=1 Tax=Methylobacterium aquaticum TaxID=270351 RepID=UPI003D173DAF
MGGPTPSYARMAADISDSTASGRIVLTGTQAQGASALGLGSGNSPAFTSLTLSSGVIVNPGGSVSLLRDSSLGGLYLQPGTAANSGFVEFYRKGAVGRDGYFGYSDGNTITLGIETGTNGYFSLAGNMRATGSITPGGYTVASLPAGVAGAQIYVSNARKVGEAAGAGTGVMAYYSNGAWRRPSDDSAVAA